MEDFEDFKTVMNTTRFKLARNLTIKRKSNIEAKFVNFNPTGGKQKKIRKALGKLH